MKIAFYSLVFNHHQSLVAKELYNTSGVEYTFIELKHLDGEATKGASILIKDYPFVLQAWKNKRNHKKAMEIALTADVCVFAGAESLSYMTARLKLGLLTFEMSERWLKKGLLNLFSPNIFKCYTRYWINKWGNKPVYKLCCSAFASLDHHRLGMYNDKCFKWGYFTKVEKCDTLLSNSNITSLMWCSRFLKLKHPELPILMAKRLKEKGYHFVLDMYGSGLFYERSIALAKEHKVEDVVNFCGSVPNDEILDAMRKHEIFLFTSDQNEGWGAVANESMSNRCALVASDAIGSIPYLINNGLNGIMFKSANKKTGFTQSALKVDNLALDSLTEKVEWLLTHPHERMKIAEQAYYTMRDVWSPENAARQFIALIKHLQVGKVPSFIDGPCSKA